MHGPHTGIGRLHLLDEEDEESRGETVQYRDEVGEGYEGNEAAGFWVLVMFSIVIVLAMVIAL